MTLIEGSLAAREHIAQIRASKGLPRDGTDGAADLGPNVADLEESLKYLSDDIYTSCTHFLLEIIQNADDNLYDSAEPTLDLTLSGSFFRIDCNERGFTPANVNAICRVRTSTKRQADSGMQFIGEKGVGFKSVFQAATTVWISSRHYSFKFDKTRRLGMIAPIWEDLPLALKSGTTTFLLKLDENYNVATLRRDLEDLDPRLLVFLRKLRRINITVVNDNGQNITKTLTRRDTQGSIVRLCENAECSDYIVLSHATTNLPYVESRAGIESSTILLAFPIGSTGQPLIKNQKVYSFLPIRDFGLRFLVHADFLLTTSREDIDASSDWNRKLRAGCADAFLGAIEALNESDLRYTWLQYLPSKSPRGNFFDDFSDMLFERLYSAKVLLSSTGILLAPSESCYAPPEYQDGHGSPLIVMPDGGTGHHVHLSPQYQFDDSEHLRALGVHYLTDTLFLDDLKTFLETHPDHFRQSEPTWQARLAEILITLAIPEHVKLMRSLELIPLSDGTWMRAEDGEFFSSSVGDNWTVPDGLGLSIVEEHAATDSARSLLFKMLGVIQLDTQQIWRQIIQEHKKDIPSDGMILRATLISQLGFLFLSGWRNGRSELSWFWLETATGSYERAHRLYRHSDEPYSASHFFGERHPSWFAHPDLISAFPDMSQTWIAWLGDNLEVETKPRMVSAADDTRFNIHPDMNDMIKHADYRDVLLYLRENWANISKWVLPQDEDDTFSNVEYSRRQLRERIGRMEVKCLGGKVIELRRAALPISGILPDDPLIQSVVDVPECDDPRWKLLRHFGAGQDRSVRSYLCLLEDLSGTNPSLSEVTHILEQIERFSSEDETQVRNMFRSKKVVFIPAVQGNEPRWVKSTECVWDGPAFLRETAVLKETYSSREKLFREVLGLQNANTAELILEVKGLKDDDRLDHFRDIFLSLNSCLVKSGGSPKVLSLKLLRVFPIRLPNSLKEFDYLGSGEEDKITWFIPDRAHLEAAFATKARLLAFGVDDIARMDKVFAAVGIAPDRLLTTVAKSFASTSAHHFLEDEFSRTLRGKATFILRLISPDDLSHNPNWSKLLSTLRVFTCETVTQEWSLQCSDVKVSGVPSPGHVALVEDKDDIRVIFSQGTFRNLISRRELTDRLCEFFKIPGSRASYLLDILSEDDHAQLRELLERYGVPQLRPEIEESLNPNKQRSSSPSSIASDKTLRLADKNDAVGKNQQLPQRHGKSPRGERFDRQPRKSSAFIKTGTSGSGHSRLLIVEGELSENADHVHITRHAGSSACNTGVKNTNDSIQERGAKKFENILRKVLNPEPEEMATAASSTTISGAPPSFIFQDTLGRFTDWLIQRGYPIPATWQPPPCYHVLVKTTSGNLYSEFELGNSELEMASPA
ncbi:hypothetical protein BCR34DRAFT_120049 [Clohesyomyces aquaticus]|uniref:Histidine kinase-like ATPase n=1 Tax=Clohesyomyces aquaticus TaxID=1231657 RepID=A0A1Y2A1E5_9PLEO|nr:hypothetical protein BCR34DRAFT_120049 [Clohesyomyces aquaticus]